MDLRRFEFDYDLTWFVFFLNAEETIYGRYGGRDAADAEARLSLKGLRFAMEQALERHQDPPKPQILTGQPLRAEDFQAARKHRGCIHCHNVNEFRRADLQAEGKWDRHSVWVYPLPENIGITLDVDQGRLIKTVSRASPADKVGLKPGDHLIQLNGYPVASFADAQYALHKAPAQGSIPIEWQRNGQKHTATLVVAEGWRKTNLTWRPSMLDLLPSVPFSGVELTAAEKKALGLAPQRAALRQDPDVHPKLKAAGVRGGDILIGYDGVAIEGSVHQLYAYVRRNYLVGDEVTINLLRDGQRLDIKLLLK